MAPSPVRRGVLLALVALPATLVPLVAAGPPAHASPSCTSETQLLACDDEKPPQTASAGGTQTAAGQVTLTATASYADGDTDPIGFQCQVAGSNIWGGCTISGLSVGSHQFAIRALDLPDSARTAQCDRIPQCLLGGPEVPDYDATPATVTVDVTSGGGGGGGGPVPPPPGPDGTPETQIWGGPSDRITPGAPVTLDRRVTVNLLASEPATFRCAVNAHRLPCHEGDNVLKRLRPGPQVFVAQAVDSDGNFDATPASISFYVPINVTADQGEGWRTVKSGRSYAHDYVMTRRTGPVLTLGRVSGIHELRLLAPTGPKLGKVAIRVGRSAWSTVILTSDKSQRLTAFEVRRADSKGLSGVIQLRALTIPVGGSVAVDALVAR